MGAEIGEVRTPWFRLPLGTLIQILVIAGGIIGAWYTMRSSLEHIREDFSQFLTGEHVELRRRVETVEERQRDVRERLSGLEAVVAEWRRHGGADQSDERWRPGGRSYSAEQNNDAKGN